MGEERQNGVETRLSENAENLPEIKQAERMLDEYERRLESGVGQMIAGLGLQLGNSGSSSELLQNKIMAEILAIRAEAMGEVCTLRGHLQEKRHRSEEKR